ncbi:MAG: sporulation integral membrane protein YtvI [Candidatus Enterenecus sp.]
MEHDLLTWPERGRLWMRLGIRAVLTAAAILLLVYAVPPLLSLLLPFVLALIVAWLLNPMVRWFQRKLSVSRKVISMVLVILLFCVIGGALFGIAWVVVDQIISLFRDWSSVTEALLSMLDSVVQWLDSLGRLLPQSLRFSADGLFDALAEWLRGLDISGWLATLAGRAPSMVSSVSSFAVATVVFITASYFITGDYPRLRFLITDRVPADIRSFCGTVKRIFMEAFGGYLKSQLLLSLGVAAILAAGFLLIGQPYGLLLAIALAVLDFIPIIGAGTVMVPWAVIDLIIGHYIHAIQFAVIWGLIVLFRRFAEPKILGNQTGLSPILSLVGIYVGMRLGGVGGMIVGPLLILVCINLAKLGIFRPVLNDLRMACRDIRGILRESRGKG